MPRDIVFCQSLELDLMIGFHDVELTAKQTLLVDLTLETDFRLGPDRDDHAGLVDYYVIAHHLRHYMEGRRYDLIEAAAVDISRQILRLYPDVTVRVRITKRPLDIPRIGATGVECVRSASDFAAEAAG